VQDIGQPVRSESVEPELDNQIFKDQDEVKEKIIICIEGGKFYTGCILAILVSIAIITISFTSGMGGISTLGFILLFISIWAMGGIVTVEPNEAVVYQLCGKYVGTLREAGIYYANPFYSKKVVSTKLQNFESNRSVVTDLNGCPIEIQAVIVWKVIDTAMALFSIEDC
jgi:hypothetical protein